MPPQKAPIEIDSENLKSMFGFDPRSEKPQPLTLFEAKPSELKLITRELNECLRADLLRMARAFWPMLKGKVAKVQQPGGKVRDFVAESKTLHNPYAKKMDLVPVLALMLADGRNRQLYADSLDSDMHALWRQLLTFFSLPDQVAALTLHLDRLPLHALGYNSVEVDRDDFGFFHLRTVHDYYYDTPSRTYVGISPFFHSLFFPHFFPQAGGPMVLSELPQPGGKPLATVDLEAECAAKWSLLASLLKDGQVAVGARGVSLVGMRKAARLVGLDEFHPSDPDPRGNIRTRLYVGLAAATRQPALDYAPMLRRMMDFPAKLTPHLPPLLFPHVKGLNTAMKERTYLPIIIRWTLDCLKAEPAGWLPVEGIVRRRYATAAAGGDYRSLYRTMEVFPSHAMHYNTRLQNTFTDEDIDEEEFVAQFGLPAFRAVAYMLCSLGIARLGLLSSKCIVSPYDDAAYLQLTPLGRYVVGLDSRYHAPQMQHQAYFELDPDRLVIRSLVDPNPYEKLLLSTSVAISPGRFETSARSFLGGCADRSDVEHKIGIFRQFVSSELPPLWEDFFARLLSHCNPLRRDAEAYTVFTLNPDDRDLVRLLTSDPALRRLVVRAEGYRLLVRTADLARLTDHLKTHGYLL